MGGESEYILELEGVSKRFPGVKALDGVSFKVRRGETHALLGMNGAGKSTLVKIIAGLYRMDSGRILLDGEAMTNIRSTAWAQELGVNVVFQELTILPHMSVLENIFIHREITRGGFYDWAEMRTRAGKIIAGLGLDLDLETRLADLSIAQQQMIEIVRAVSFDAKVIILDEPTSSLSPKECDSLFGIMRTLKGKGVTIVYISHRLDEIYANCDRITLLRDGKWVLTERTEDLPKDRLISNMLGRKLEEAFPVRRPRIGEEILRVEHLSYKRKFRDLGFSLRKGEILGFAGLVGAGRTEAMKAVFGEHPKESGAVYLGGKKVSLGSAKAALKRGLAYATEDRKVEGLMLTRSIRENISLSSLRKITRRGLIDRARERQNSELMIRELRIATSGVEQKALDLSGGNQQKVSLAKCLLTDPKVLILDEPTRGIDVGAKAEFYKIIADLADKGVGVILISSEEEELVGLCDRILVMHDGRISGEITEVEGCEERLMRCMLALTDGDGPARQPA